jgi:putative membrane protein
LLCGVAIVAWLVARTDAVALLRVFPRIGWGFALIVLARAATIVIDAAAWICVLPRAERPPFSVMVPLRWIGEAINTTLPAAQIGGDVVRARLLQQRMPAPGHATAAGIIDFVLSLFAQFLYTLLGFVLLALLSRAAAWWPVVLSAALVPGFAIGCWELLVRRRVLAAAERSAERFGQRRLAAGLQALGAALALLAESRATLALSLALHATSWLGHIAELWLTLHLMGVPVGFAEAAMLETLSLAARSAAFLIPSGWGAQEAALIALGGLTGLSADTALAVGLVKRAREMALGLPGLAAWAVAERRRPARRPG